MEGRNGAKHLIAREQRRAAVLQLRKGGTTIRAIAGIVGTSARTVRNDLQVCYAELARDQRATTEQIRNLQVSRLETLLSSVWGEAVVGNLEAVRTAAALVEQISKLYGLHDVEPTPALPALPSVQPIIAVLLTVLDGHPELKYRAAAAIAELDVTPEAGT